MKTGFNRPAGRVAFEDILNLNLDGRPAEIDILFFGGRPVAYIPPDHFSRQILNDIARALVDRGWSRGLRDAEVRVESYMEQTPVGPCLLTQMKAALRYARIG